MVSKYTGKVPCPGCGRTGEECARDSKDRLCQDCQKELEIGRAICKQRDLKRNWYRFDELTGTRLQFHRIHNGELHARLKVLLSTFSEFDTDFVGQWGDLIHNHGIGSDDRFVLPEKTFQAAKDLVESLDKIATELDNDRDNYKRDLEKQCAEELAAQKNAIYNEGVAHGRNLLMQLNNNEITPSQFVEPVKRF